MGEGQDNRIRFDELVDSEHHIHIHTDIDQKLDQIIDLLNQLTTMEEVEIMDLTNLQTEVTNNTTVEASAVALIQGLADQIAAAANDPAALQTIVDTLRTNDAALAAAVTVNTPAAPAATDAPAPDAPAAQDGTSTPV